MISLSRLRAPALAIAATCALAAPTLAADAPDATIHFHSVSVAFIAGVNWGSGRLHYKGKDIPLKVSGLSVGAIGANSSDADGDVYNLRHVSDIEGTYAAVNADATIGGGEGVLDMKNNAGVEIRVHATSAGLKASLGPAGVVIKLS